MLASDREDVVQTVRLCHETGVPFVARGSGTGLSGGALPVADGVLIVLSRLRQIVRVDPDNARVVVEPGVINLWVTREAAPYDQAYAPDPSSQQVCSIGGNVAENAGGAHCLKYGFTVNHVMGAEVVLADGEVVHLGGTAPEHPGYDLLGAFVGSEGTLGVATQVTVRTIQVPEKVQTMLVGFSSVEDAAATVSDIIAAGILPAAIEMMDALAIEAAEAAVRCGYPAGAVAVLVIELDGPAVEVDEQFRLVEELATKRNAFETRIAQDAAERALMWKGRKSAFAAVGRISPAYIVQDGVIPRTQLPEVLADIARLADEAQMRVANVFHAGDGNLHPLILFDDAVEGAEHAAEQLGFAILELCIEKGGSITGEHGVGVEKKSKMSRQFSADDLDTMQLVRCAFDPDGLANPGKLFPTPAAVRGAAGRAHGCRRPRPGAGRGVLSVTTLTATRPGTPDDGVCGVVPAEVVRPGSVAEVADVLRSTTGTVVPVGSGSKTGWAAAPTSCDLRLDTTGLDRVVEYAPGDLVVVAEAGVRLDAPAGAARRAGAGARARPARARRDPRRHRQRQRLRAAPAALRHGPRPADRRHRGARRRHDRDVRRQGRQERRRLRPRQALHRRARHPRRRRLDHLAAAPAAAGRGRRRRPRVGPRRGGPAGARWSPLDDDPDRPRAVLAGRRRRAGRAVRVDPGVGRGPVRRTRSACGAPASGPSAAGLVRPAAAGGPGGRLVLRLAFEPYALPHVLGALPAGAPHDRLGRHRRGLADGAADTDLAALRAALAPYDGSAVLMPARPGLDHWGPTPTRSR